MPISRALLSLSLLFAAASCAAPLQSGGVDVRPGAADRLDLMCRFRPGSGGQEVCALPAQD